MQNRSYDKRIIKRSIKSGLVTGKDYDKYLKGLDDMNDNFVTIDLVDEEANIEDMPSTQYYKE